MEFFLNEILDDGNVKEAVKNSTELYPEAERTAEQFISSGIAPKLAHGIFPVIVLGCLADYALKKNSSRGISREVTVETLKDINIWIENYKLISGKNGLAEFHWLKYHYTGDLFRLGRLQFRINRSLDGVPSGEYSIETHIPQGEPLTESAALDSFSQAKDFFKNHFPEYSPEYFMCDSWILNPNLALVLDESSNIVKFMRLWTPFPFKNDNSAQAMERVFGFGTTLDTLPSAPENTSLQRRLKAYLLSGGTLEITGGYRII